MNENEIYFDLFKGLRDSYNKINNAYWLSIIGIAGWTGSYAIKGKEVIGKWQCDDIEERKLTIFCILFFIFAISHWCILFKTNRKIKRALTFLFDVNFMEKSKCQEFALSLSGLNRKYLFDISSYTGTLILLLVLYSLPWCNVKCIV